MNFAGPNCQRLEIVTSRGYVLNWGGPQLFTIIVLKHAAKVLPTLLFTTKLSAILLKRSSFMRFKVDMGKRVQLCWSLQMSNGVLFILVYARFIAPCDSYEAKMAW